MNKIKFFLVAIFFSLAFANSLKAESIDPRFWSLYQRVVEINTPWFNDVNFIPQDSPILIPISPYTDQVEFFYMPGPVNGRYYSLWRVSEEIFANYYTPQPKPEVEQVEDRPADMLSETSTKDIGLLTIGILLLAMIMAMYILWLTWKKNPDRFPPVIRGGLSKDLNVVKEQIESLRDPKDTRIIRNVETGHFSREYGPHSIPVLMNFADRQREIPFKPADPSAKIIYTNGDVEYYRNRCGNKMSPIYGGAEKALQIPDGWRFIVSSTYQVPAATNDDTPANNAPAIDGPTPVSATDELKKLMSSLPKGTVSAEIIVHGMGMDSASVTLTMRDNKK